MLDHNQLTPEEAQEQNQPLIRDLRRYYDTRAEDSTSLARIQARLLEKTTSLPVTENPEESPPLPRTKHQKNGGRTFMHTFVKDRSRYHSLGTLAAAILLIVLVGSFALLLHSGPGTGAVEHGWSLIKKFSGTGNQTITGQNIEVGHKFGWLITCTNTQQGSIAVKFDENADGSSWSICQGSNTGPLGPGANITSPATLPPIHTIVVTTDASTSWELLLFEGTYYPPLSIDSANWRPLLDEMDGSGNGMWGVNVTLPRTWALLFTCHGTGNIQISLQSGYGPGSTEVSGARAPCNGQTNFDVSDTAVQGEQVSQVQFTTGANNDWQAIIIGCTNGKPHCGIITVTPTSTP